MPGIVDTRRQWLVASLLAALAATHAVGDSEHEVVAGERAAAGGRQDFRAGGAGSEGNERIIIARFPRAAVGQGGPMEGRVLWHGGFAWV